MTATMTKTTKTVVLTDRSGHTAYFEGDLDRAGYIIVNLPIEDWRKMNEPTSLTITMVPA